MQEHKNIEVEMISTCMNGDPVPRVTVRELRLVPRHSEYRNALKF